MSVLIVARPERKGLLERSLLILNIVSPIVLADEILDIIKQGDNSSEGSSLSHIVVHLSGE
jgi:hypothetical protein